MSDPRLGFQEPRAESGNLKLRGLKESQGAGTTGQDFDDGCQRPLDGVLQAGRTFSFKCSDDHLRVQATWPRAQLLMAHNFITARSSRRVCGLLATGSLDQAWGFRPRVHGALGNQSSELLRRLPSGQKQRQNQGQNQVRDAGLRRGPPHSKLEGRILTSRHLLRNGTLSCNKE